MELTFKRIDILEELKANREEHIQIVQEAQTGFRVKWTAMLEEALTSSKAGMNVKPSLHLQVPESHVDDFDRAIQMFEMTTDDDVTLEEVDFQMYVRNQWRWHSQFLLSNSHYSDRATAMLDEEP